ncbi:MAG: DUF1318 domain-containing protein [Desulfocapsaceae bacterium]
MYYRNYIFAIISIFIISFLSAGEQAAADSVKDRMLARIPAINALKDKGLIGENNRGFLEYRTGEKPQQDMVNAENQDRKTVYQSIAQSQKVDAVLVGQRRANQIAANGVKGHWFQNADGSWYKK